MSRPFTCEDDSDEDKVEYLDYNKADEASNSSSSKNNRKSSHEKKTIKYKPLFQHKRYKGDLEKEKYIDNIDAALWEGKDAQAHPEQDNDYHDYKEYDNSDPVPIEQIESPARTIANTPRLKRQLQIDEASVNKNLQQGNAPRADFSPAIGASLSRQPLHTPQAGAMDIGQDRPAHWNRTRSTVPPRPLGKGYLGHAVSKSGKSAKMVSNVKPAKVAQIPKPKALPSQTTQLDFGENNVKPSFKPSWLISTQPSSAINVGRRTQVTPTEEERQLIEAIQEDGGSPVAAAADGSGNGSYSSSFRPPPRCIGELGFDHEGFGSPSGGDRTRHMSPLRSGSVTVHSLSTPHRDPYSASALDVSTSGGGLHSGFVDSASKLSRGRSEHGHSSKAKPGSLKAKLQKIWRDNDANENRIINIPLDHTAAKSRALDLQDPRTRAVMHIDAEVTQILPEQAPFILALLTVLASWHKPAQENRASSSSVVSGDSDGGIVPCPVGSVVLGYFKPDTCVGIGRALVAGTVLRVYDAQLWSGAALTAAALVAGADCVMINTNCWEPVDIVN